MTGGKNVDVRPNWKEKPGMPDSWEGRRSDRPLARRLQWQGAARARLPGGAGRKAAIAEAAKLFSIPPARRNKIVVTRTQAAEKRKE
jgi:hypothetical protein